MLWLLGLFDVKWEFIPLIHYPVTTEKFLGIYGLAQGFARFNESEFCLVCCVCLIKENHCSLSTLSNPCSIWRLVSNGLYSFFSPNVGDLALAVSPHRIYHGDLTPCLQLSSVESLVLWNLLLSMASKHKLQAVDVNENIAYTIGQISPYLCSGMLLIFVWESGLLFQMISHLFKKAWKCYN